MTNRIRTPINAKGIGAIVQSILAQCSHQFHLRKLPLRFYFRRTTPTSPISERALWKRRRETPTSIAGFSPEESSSALFLIAIGLTNAARKLIVPVD
ncbi:hypothetical protein Trydic_g10627 [Trypoxylus dichotomus]